MRHCADLADAGTVNSITTMLLALRDDYFDEMSVLLHAAERAPVANVYVATRECLTDLSRHAPKWCDTIVRRHLNANEQLTGFSIKQFVDTMQQNDEAFTIVSEIAGRLHADNAISDEALGYFIIKPPDDSAG